MEMIKSTEIRNKAHLGSCSNHSKIELNGARREVEALVEINFFFFFAFIFLYFFSLSASQE